MCTSPFEISLSFYTFHLFMSSAMYCVFCMHLFDAIYLGFSPHGESFPILWVILLSMGFSPGLYRATKDLNQLLYACIVVILTVNVFQLYN